MNAQDNYFSLLRVPRQFRLDESTLQTHWKALSSQVHPDRFATASAAEKRVAVQWAARINEAYQCLKSPLKRATYLFELAGIALNTEQQTVKDPEFLMKQMMLREALDEADTPEALAELSAQVQADIQTIQGEMADVFASPQAQPSPERLESAADRLREWMFLDKLLRSFPQAPTS